MQAPPGNAASHRARGASRNNRGALVRNRRLKPDPGLLLRAAGKLHVTPEHAVYVGDEATDMKAALSAKSCPACQRMGAIGISHGSSTREELLASGADLVIDDLSELPAALERLAQERKAPIGAVLFDRDGTYVDSWLKYANAVKEGTEAIGRPMTLAQIEAALGRRAWSSKVDSLYPKEDQEKFNAAFRRAFHRTSDPE